MEVALVALFSIILAVPITMWQGFILAKLWLWFAVPIFGLAPLAFVPAMGLCVLIGFLVSHVPLKMGEPTPSELLTHQINSGFFVPGFSLLVGWLVHLCM